MERGSVNQDPWFSREAVAARQLEKRYASAADPSFRSNFERR
jgi:hypothetical protein